MHAQRIGLDGRALGNINRSRGIGCYTANLLESLVKACDDFELVLCGYGRPADCDLLSPGALDSLQWYELPKPRNPSVFALPYEHLLLARAIEDAGLDLFHAIDHNMTPFLRCPFTLTVHDLIPLVLRGPYLGPTAWMGMLAHGRAARKARMVVAVSHNTRQDVERLWHIPRDHLAVIPEGVSDIYRPMKEEAAIHEATARYGIARPYFLYIGGFDPRKNIHTLLLSFKRFTLAGDGDFQLVLCGDASGFQDYLQEEISELGLEGKVVPTGYVPEERLPALYSGARALLCLSAYEGFGLPPLEAMACGTPVLASRVSSIPEVVGDAGLLVDPLDPAEIVAGMESLAYDDQTRQRLITRGLDRSTLFTWDKTADQLLLLFHKLMQGGGRDKD